MAGLVVKEIEMKFRKIKCWLVGHTMGFFPVDAGGKRLYQCGDCGHEVSWNIPPGPSVPSSVGTIAVAIDLDCKAAIEQLDSLISRIKEASEILRQASGAGRVG